MPGKDTKTELQQRIEKGDFTEDVLLFFLNVQNVRSAELARNEDLRAAFKAQVRERVALEVTEKRPEHVSLTLDPKPEESAVLVQVVVTPPKGCQANGLLAALGTISRRERTTLGAAVAERLATVRGLVEQGTEGSAIKVELRTPSIAVAHWPKVKPDKKVPHTVYALYESMKLLDDIRRIKAMGSTDPETEDPELLAVEVTWAMLKTAEVMKDPKLERLFVMLVSNLLKQDRNSCNNWAGSLAPSALQFILGESPMADTICKNSFGVARQEWQLYAMRCKACVAVAIVGCNMQERWSSSFTAEDKAFLCEAADKLGTWPGLTMGDARGLWDRSTCRFVAISGLARNKMIDPAMAYLNKCQREILCSRFPAPWRERPEQEASFLYLYRTFAEHCGCKAAEDLCDCLVQAFARPSADLPTALRAFAEDPQVHPRRKRDFIVAFVSACRRLKSAPNDSKKAKAKEEFKPPDIAGVDLIVLEALLKEAAAVEEQAKAGHSGLKGMPAELAITFEAVLLLSTGDNLYEWARRMRNEDSQTAEAAKRFIDQTACQRVALVLQSAGDDKNFRYEDAKAMALISDKEAWIYDGRGRGFFTDCLAKNGRRPEEVGQVIRMFIKLDLALSAGCSAKLVKLVDQDSECLANRFNRLVPQGGALRAAINKDVRRGLGGTSLEIKEIDTLLSYIGFFNTSFQSFLRHDSAIHDMRDCFEGTGFSEVAFTLLEAIMKLISLKREMPAGHTVREVIGDICDQIRNDPLTGQLFSKVLEELQRRDFREVGDGFDGAQLRDCAKELRRASQLIQYKQARGVSMSLLGDTERVINSFLTQSLPKTWVSSLRSLDTVIFALEYMGKEDLQLAYERFEEECKSSEQDQLVDLLRCVQKIYSHPLSGTSSGITPDMDVKQLIKSKAPKLTKNVMWRGISFLPSDWDKVLDIAAAAADAMKQRYNILMLPHHTQIIALLMFGFRACGAGSSGAGFRELPKTLLARVGTGEGKSMIIGMLAAFVAKKGMRAHVINDDRLLTQRDFAVNEKMFKALGIRASNNPADLKDQDCLIVYCTGDDVEGSCLDSLTEGQAEEYEDSLRETILIVDEVDGMVFDKGVTSSKLFEDRDFSDLVNEWLRQLSASGAITREWDDWRSMGEGAKVLQEETEAAFKEAGRKEEGYDYTKRGDELYMMDLRTNKIAEKGWSLWLEILRSQKTDPPGFVHYKYVKAILCRLQCFMSYSCIFGLTGSLGQSAEKIYLAEHYEAVTFNVPFFLDTCRADGGGVAGKRALTNIGDVEPLPSLQEQDKAVISLAAAKCAEVPVLVIARDPEDVECLAKDLEQELNKLYGEEPAEPAEEGADGDQAEEGVGAPRRVIQLLHNPRNPREFVELVGYATEPVRSRSKGGPSGTQRWPVTLTTAEGGRGHDYRVTDPAIDEKGGLLLILTWVPASEREWIQFLGRTGRQDHCGQYAVLLSYEDDEVQAARSMREAGEGFEQALLRRSDQETAKMLQGFNEEISKGRLMHKLTSRYWTLHQQDKTTKRQDWDWKRLCEGYLELPDKDIQKRFEEIVPPERQLVVDAEEVHYEGEWKCRVRASPQTAQHPGDPGCLDMEEEDARPPPAPAKGKKGKKDYQSLPSASMRRPEESTYSIRTIRFFGMERRILGGPDEQLHSPLMALCNVLLLRNQLALPEDTATISSTDLMLKVTNLLVDLHSGARVSDDPRCAEMQQLLDVAVEALPSFQLAVDLDCRFSGPAEFEMRRELSVFDLLEVSILHGWVVSPLDKEAFAVVAPHSCNELRDRLAELEEVKQRLDDEEDGYADRGLEVDELQNLLNDIQVIEDVPVIRDFLDRSASQLTYEGIIQLHEAMGDREVAVFFRNHAFGTLLRHKDELFILSTDPVFAKTPVVWERLAAVDTDMAFLDTDFRVPAPGSSGASATPRPPAPAPSVRPRGPRLEQATPAPGGLEEATSTMLRCRRCGILNSYSASPVPGRLAPTLRCGACGELQGALAG